MTTETLKTLLTDRWARFDHELYLTIEELTTAGKNAQARRFEHKRKKYSEAVGVTLKMLDDAMHVQEKGAPDDAAPGS